jgi:pRiA4b ORF-3-like protein
MNRDPQPSFTYQLRIVLRDVSPLIWRRLLVPSNIDLALLSRILQILFSWSGEHLDCFHIHGKDYGTAYKGTVSSGNDPSQVRLSDFHSTAVNASYINTISLPVGSWRFASRTFYRLTRRALIRSVSAAKEPDRRGIVLEPGPIFNGGTNTSFIIR